MLHKTTSKCYDKFCADHQTVLPLFYNSWYLDAACGKESWDAAVFTDKNGQTLGIWPYHIKSKYGLRYITMPTLTPYMGPWIVLIKEAKSSTINSNQHNIISTLNANIPDVHFSTIHTHPDLLNLLSLQWAGYQELKRYTYRLDLSNGNLWENLDAKQRNIIRKAGSTLIVRQSSDIEKFYDYNSMSFDRQSEKIPYKLNELTSIDNALNQQNSRVILQAHNPTTGRTHGMIYLVYDQLTVYLIAIGSDSEERHQGSIPLLVWKAISKFSTSHKIFDFEGSMIPNIERFFRSFGGTLIPYSRLFRSKHIGIDLILKLSGRYG